MRAKAVVFEAVRKVAVKDINLPAPTAKDIVVETEVSGVSVGTERWALIGKRAEVKFPNVPGYMGIGRVLKVGPEAAKRGYVKGGRVNFFWTVPLSWRRRNTQWTSDGYRSFPPIRLRT